MKKLLLLFAAILMASTGMWATDNVAYIDANGLLQHKDGVTEITNSTTTLSGWCVVKGTVSTGTLTCSGDVHLILADGAKLTANGATSYAGITVSGEGNSLTIYGQTAQSGHLIATGGDAGGAGIGGKRTDSGSNITINGGTITATTEGWAAGIGGGYQGNGSHITINGGTVTATGGYYAAGIGGGPGGSGSDITINGGTVTANGGTSASCIGSGKDGTASNIFVAVWCILKAGSSSDPTDVIENTGSDLATDLAGKQYATTEPDPHFVHVAYIDEQGEEQYVYAKTITSSDSQVAWRDDWYIVSGADVRLSQGAVCQTDVHLILADGAKLTATGGENQAGIAVSEVGSSLTIYGQAAQSGQLKAKGGDSSAGIGGGFKSSGSNITINGGTVTANGGRYGAGIGGGADIGSIKGGSGSYITINGGTVTANGGTGAAGIGGGDQGSGSYITINGGTVKANGGDYSAGIGGGYLGSGSYITINGGTVQANAGSDASGIGNGEDATTSPSNIFVATWYMVKADRSENPTTEIAPEHTSTTDLATDLANQLYVTVEIRKCSVVYGNNITVSPAFASGAEIEAGTQITFTAADRSANNYVFIGFYKESTFDTPITTGVSGRTYTATVSNAPIAVYARYDSNQHSYVYPVYNDPQYVTKGVKEWRTATVNAIEVASSDTPVAWGENGKTTWYVVTGKDVQFTKGAICYGKVHLILADGAKLTANGDYNNAGIQVAGYDNSLTIYGQTAQSGQLEANGGGYSAGIGGGEIGPGSNITINGGRVTATGGTGAGIGGGLNSSGSNITINGGTVTATGDDGAGIGGGGKEGSGSDITINGGTVTATGGTGAGIGGGGGGNGFYITINSGKVRVNSGYGAGIGGGYRGGSNSITVNGGTVAANGGWCAAGIGGGYNGLASTNTTVATALIVKADGNNPPTTVIENIGGDLAESLEGKQYVTITEPFFNITANQDPDHRQNYYSTFYSRTCAYQVPEGVTAYTGAVDGSVLQLTAIADGILPAGEAVILRLTSADNTATKQQFALTATTKTATKSSTNALTGTDVAIEELGANDYALSLGQHGVGFYQWSGKALGANKAYLTLDEALGVKALQFRFNDEPGPTGIKAPSISPKRENPATYDLKGMLVNDGYKGIVIRNGKKALKK